MVIVATEDLVDWRWLVTPIQGIKGWLKREIRPGVVIGDDGVGLRCRNVSWYTENYSLRILIVTFNSRWDLSMDGTY